MHIKVPHYTSLKSAENYFMTDSMMQKKSISQISETYALLGWEKIINFKFSKNLQYLQRDLNSRSVARLNPDTLPIDLWENSTKLIDGNTSIKHLFKSCDVVSSKKCFL